MSLLALTVVLLSANAAERPSGAVVQVHELATLAPQDAATLAGRPALFRVMLDSAEDTEGTFTLYDCQSLDGKLRSVWLWSGQELQDEMTVQATLQVIHHPVSVGDGGTPFQGFREYRLARAVRKK